MDDFTHADPSAHSPLTPRRSPQPVPSRHQPSIQAVTSFNRIKKKPAHRRIGTPYLVNTHPYTAGITKYKVFPLCIPAYQLNRRYQLERFGIKHFDRGSPCLVIPIQKIDSNLVLPAVSHGKIDGHRLQQWFGILGDHRPETSR